MDRSLIFVAYALVRAASTLVSMLARVCGAAPCAATNRVCGVASVSMQRRLWTSSDRTAMGKHADII
jgi:hypothetical protein